jgi:small subunit ribosomal protein S3Ae
MAKKVKKAKTIDAWKMKKRYEVIAPDIFNNVSVGPIFSKEPENLVGRVVETTLSNLVNSNQHHIKVYLLVTGTQGFNALTTVKGVELSRAYISSQTNPGNNIIENTFKIKTNDGKKAGLKTLMFTRGKAHMGQKKALRELTEEVIKDTSSNADYDQLVQNVVFGKLGSLIFGKSKKIAPLGRVEVRKLELLG